MDIDSLLTYIELRSLNDVKKVKSRENDAIAILMSGFTLERVTTMDRESGYS